MWLPVITRFLLIAALPVNTKSLCNTVLMLVSIVSLSLEKRSYVTRFDKTVHLGLIIDLR